MLGISAVYNGEPYQLSGELTNFAKPTADLKLVSDVFNVDTRINILNQAFQFAFLTGSYRNSLFNLKGDVHVFEDAAPDIDLRGKFDVDLKDVSRLLSEHRKTSERIDLSGVVSGEGIFKGKPGDWRNWQLTFDAASNHAGAFDYDFRDIALRYDQRDMNVSNCNVSSLFYGGKLSVTSSVDLTAQDAQIVADVVLDKMDLYRLRIDRKLKNKQLSGILSLKARLNGPILRPRGLNGEGSFNVTDGNLIQWNILDGISNALLIPEFKAMTFTEGRGNFIIKNEKLQTKNTRLTGEVAVLDATGWMDFDQNLNFNIKPTFSELAILQSKSGKKGPTSIITQTKDYLNIKLTGTLRNPNYSVEKFPMKILEETIGGTTGTLKEVIGSIVEEIF